MKKTYGIHWFRRDLRIIGNPALSANLERHQGRVLGIFCFDKKFLARPDFSENRFAFFLNTLAQLKSDLEARGGSLLFLDQGPETAFSELLSSLKRSEKPLPSLWSWNRDYEPFALKRDQTITQLLEHSFKIPTHTDRDHLLIEPSEIQSQSKSFYQVFTPFSNQWKTFLASKAVQERIRDSLKDPGGFSLAWKELLGESAINESARLLEDYRTKVTSRIQISLPEAGELAARARIVAFKKNTLAGYDIDRDIPSVRGTSGMSIYLKNGSITIAQIISTLNPKRDSKYLTELCWREFYYHILFHRPDVETESFNPKYAKLAWENREDYFEAWCEGKTGYPIVDAGMRQLKKHGWMHNRVRMIVASFLTKDLLIDYRWGEKHFMHLLLDGDLAPNNGGWQWAASTGCDPQPYFRIFNPVLQSKRFDPDGTYIRKYVPELSKLSAKEIHEPWKSGQTSPVVEHSLRSKKAIALYKGA
jgi:deoxyribodipyrimidine photo-lyase